MNAVKEMTLLPSDERHDLTPAKRHIHACSECGREFYLCSQRDCGIAPNVCQGCELDRMDAYLNTIQPPPEVKEIR